MNHRPTVDGNKAEQRPVYRPSVDIMDSPGDVVLVADVPGVDESHLDVTLDKNVLTIRGGSNIRRSRDIRPCGRNTASGTLNECLRFRTTSIATRSRRRSRTASFN